MNSHKSRLFGTAFAISSYREVRLSGIMYKGVVEIVSKNRFDSMTRMVFKGHLLSLSSTCRTSVWFTHPLGRKMIYNTWIHWEKNGIVGYSCVTWYGRKWVYKVHAARCDLWRCTTSQLSTSQWNTHVTKWDSSLSISKVSLSAYHIPLKPVVNKGAP